MCVCVCVCVCVMCVGVVVGFMSGTGLVSGTEPYEC